eukprot:PITA_14459
MDVKTNFLNGVIEEEVYIEQPQGFEVHERKTHVCRLKKYLYGLKQAPRAWYSQIYGYLMSLDFTKSDVDPNLYYKVVGGGPMILLLYVDDLFLTRADNLIVQCKRELNSEFEMKDFWINALLLRIRSVERARICEVHLERFTDFDWARTTKDRKRKLGCCFSLGSIMISSMRRKQTTVALNTIEVEYIATYFAICEEVWLRKLLAGLFDQMLELIVIHCDNQSYVKLSKNLVFHDRSKHIEIKYHYIRNMVQKGAVRLQYISTYEQVSNILTKPLPMMKFV